MFNIENYMILQKKTPKAATDRLKKKVAVKTLIDLSHGMKLLCLLQFLFLFYACTIEEGIASSKCPL